jgi:hypothetical protein
MAVGNSSPATANATSPQQAVIVQFDYGNKDWAPFFEFEKGFEAANL